MKKLLSTMAAMTLATTTIKATITCSDQNMSYYNQFINGINNKESFIFMVSAKNCIHCQNTTDTTIPDLYNKNGYGNDKYDKYLAGNFGAQYALKTYPISADEQEKIKNTRLIITDNIKDYNGIWKEKWAKKIADWIVTQEQNAHKINREIDKTITADSLGLTGLPTYVYIKNGNYVGFETGEVGNLQTEANSDLWMNRFIKHMVLEDWDIYHNKS
ncbi:putative lipoprotein [Spiroplasma kunkelii CR2-3x]|uniref:Putative lipoprotein n=1 Tax=Spiroplasma kunkelii CR2-3x TaxID=273035 RepID=A0A0K2JG69_SPIKU|nr:hypothetical protein [Spiroplasma kunkelii]ALA97590.1 putative lipoprotein [Spiroplasma kunkelii CR2-3x]